MAEGSRREAKSEPTSPPIGERAARMYEQERSRYIENEFQTSRDFDRWSLTVSGAALGLSVTFLKDVVSAGAVRHHWVLALAWVSLIASIGMILAALKCGLWAHRVFRLCLDDAAKEKFDGQMFVRANDKQSACRSARWATSLRWGGLATCLLGLALIILFAVLNFGGANGQARLTEAPGGEGPTATATVTADSATATAKWPKRPEAVQRREGDQDRRRP